MFELSVPGLYAHTGHIQGHTSWSSTAWPACGYETRKWSILVHFLPTGGTAGGVLSRSRRRTRMCSVCTCTLGRRVRCCVTEINNKSSDYSVISDIRSSPFHGKKIWWYPIRSITFSIHLEGHLTFTVRHSIKMWPLKGGSTVPVSWGSGPHWDVAAQRRFYCTCVMRLRTSLRCGCSKEVLLYLCHEARDLIEVWLLKGGSTVPVSWGSGSHRSARSGGSWSPWARM